jgi:sulfotransferase family protein
MRPTEEANARGSAQDRLPDFVIIGAPRSGTTSLSWYLTGHPDVYIPRHEVRYFDQRFDRGIDWYRAHFEGATPKQRVGEKTPSYMFGDQAMKRMAEVVPAARLVAILREPIARAYSSYWFRQGLGERPRTFEDVLDEELAPGYVEPWKSPPLIAAGMYLPALERVCTYYPRDSLLVLLFEDLRERPEQTFAALCDFLGVVERAEPVAKAGPRVNEAKRTRSRRLYDAMRTNRVLLRLPPSLRWRIDGWNRVPFTYPDMDPRSRERLIEVFAEPNRALGRWLGRDLSMWETL